MSYTLAGSNLKELLFWLLRLRRRFRVTGASMRPLLNPGDEVLVDPNAYRQAPPRPGDIIIARHPYRTDIRLIKRIAATFDNDSYHLTGDNPADGTDSRAFGTISRNHILGRVTSRFL